MVDEAKKIFCTTDMAGIKRWRIEYSLLPHREDGPAVEYPDGSFIWYYEGLIHRLNKPAFVSADGTKEWFINGRRHREDGPAVECSTGEKQWWIGGKLIYREEPND